ncbi:MAG: hypothetical protein N2578_01980 [Bdellovibrionaceae bacterium]|nr:hypothetical protein [Pseudobdellovibrionaceae bacterium]
MWKSDPSNPICKKERTKYVNKSNDRLLYDVARQEEVIGVTVELLANFFKIVDSVAVSLFEAGAGDLKFSEDKGMSVRLSKRISDQLRAQISTMLKENGSASKESRTSVGFVFSSCDGSLKIWAEGLVITDTQKKLEGAQYGGTIGGFYRVGPGAVVVEYSVLQDQASEIAAAYNMPVGRHLVLSPEIRHRMNDNGSDETVVGIRARLQFHYNVQKGLLTGRRG